LIILQFYLNFNGYFNILAYLGLFFDVYRNIRPYPAFLQGQPDLGKRSPPKRIHLSRFQNLTFWNFLTWKGSFLTGKEAGAGMAQHPAEQGRAGAVPSPGSHR
jgi:hypothetical protein